MKTAQEMYRIALPIMQAKVWTPEERRAKAMAPIVKKADEVVSAAIRGERRARIMTSIMRRIESAANEGDMSCFLEIDKDCPGADRETMHALKEAGYLVECVFDYDDHSDNVFWWYVGWHPKDAEKLNNSLWDRIKSWFVGCES